MLWWFAQTTLIAGGLAVVATLAGRWRRLGPEVKHSLWLLVLLKLAIPPLIAWPWIVPDAWPTLPLALALGRVEPRPAAAPAPAPVPMVAPEAVGVKVEAPFSVAVEEEPLAVVPAPPGPDEITSDPIIEATEAAGVPAGAEVMEAVADPAPIAIVGPASLPKDQRFEISNPGSVIGHWPSIVVALWLAGSVAVVARRGFKVLRFHRALAGSTPAPDWMVDEVRAIGDRVGVRPPPVVASPRVATPLLWCLGRPRLILPEVLIKRLGADRWPGILAHELAHLARCDHWVVRLELLVEAVWWWNPLFWLARRRLRELAEVACDARVVRALPERRFDYAEALVDVCEHIARSAIPSPSLGVGGAGAAHSLEGRLHMILKDPIPRRPSRRAAVLAVLLAALAAPAWTLGQQPEPPPNKPDAPTSKPGAPASEPIQGQAPGVPAPKPAPSPAPEAPRPVAPAPNQEPPSIAAVRAAQGGKWEILRQLSFRLVVAERERSRSTTQVLPLAGVVTGNQFKGGNVTRVDRSKSVAVKVADVTLDPRSRFRCDVLEARPRVEGLPDLTGAPRPLVAWDRRFVALDAEGYTAQEMAWNKSGPVPFRWLGARSRPAFGDSLTAAFSQGPNQGFDLFPASGLDREIEPLDPSPRNVLDLAGVPPFLDVQLTRAEVLGFDKVDGRDAVRIAWSATANIGLRGLCWVAPELGDAVVLLSATRDPAPDVASDRLSWRRRSSDFVEVADHLWLPRKVTFEQAWLDPAGGEPTLRREHEMTFEGYRVDQPAAADTFRPKLTIRDLDDRSGDFTADAPALPTGLVDRLAKAVAESKFGPPGVEKTVEEPRAVATQANASQPKPGDQPGVTSATANDQHAKPGDQPSRRSGDSQLSPGSKPGDRRVSEPRPSASSKPTNQVPFPGRTYADIVTNVDEAPAGRLMFGAGQPGSATVAPSTKPGTPRSPFELDPPADPAKADPGIIARPAPNFEDPIPTIDPKVDDPISAKPSADRTAIDREVGRRFTLDPEVKSLLAEIKAAESRLEDGKKRALNADDPANKANQRRLNTLVSRYKQFWDIKSETIREELGAERSRSGDEAEVMQARRDGKAAEVRKAEAQRDLARLARENTARLRQRQGVSENELVMANGQLAVAQAEMESKQAELAEADALLNQVRRRIGGASPASDPTAPSGDRPTSLPQLRDDIELMEVQLQAKQAELRGVESKANLARRQLDRITDLVNKNAIEPKIADETNDRAEVARAELDAKKAEVLESETRLKQARRRLAAAEARARREVERVKSRFEWSENMLKKGYVSKTRYDADKAAYDELMIQLDPKYVPAPPAELPSTSPAPKDQSRKDDAPPDKAAERLTLLLADVERAKDRLKWSDDMFKKGYVSKATNLADQLTYDGLVREMLQLDPKYVPERPASSPGDQSRKDEAGARLSVRLVGEKARLSVQNIEYHLFVSNPGTQPAKGVKVVASLPRAGGKLHGLPGGAKFDQAARTLIWSIAQLEPRQEIELIFRYGTSTPGLYKATAEATSGDLRADGTMTTEVSTVAVLYAQITQTARVVNVGKTNFYEITIKNAGTKDATRLQLTGKLTKNLRLLRDLNVAKREFKFNLDSGEFVFPEIERLGVGESITRSLEVQATETGPAGCHVFLAHAESGPQDAKVEDVISTTVTSPENRVP